MLAEKLRQLRKKQGLTQEQLAEELHVSRQAIAKWESGADLPDIENLVNISRFFQVSTDWLLDVHMEKEPPHQSKWLLLAFFLFLLGIALGIVSGSFIFGFVLAVLLPCLVLCLGEIVQERKYAKQKQTSLQKELVASKLPRTLYGKVLPTSTAHKKERLKWYALEATLMAGLLSLFDIVGALFGKSTLWKLHALDSPGLDTLLSCGVYFAGMFVLYFFLAYFINEHQVKKYNRLSGL